MLKHCDREVPLVQSWHSEIIKETKINDPILGLTRKLVEISTLASFMSLKHAMLSSAIGTLHMIFPFPGTFPHLIYLFNHN